MQGGLGVGVTMMVRSVRSSSLDYHHRVDNLLVNTPITTLIAIVYYKLALTVPTVKYVFYSWRNIHVSQLLDDFAMCTFGIAFPTLILFVTITSIE